MSHHILAQSAKWKRLSDDNLSGDSQMSNPGSMILASLLIWLNNEFKRSLTLPPGQNHSEFFLSRFDSYETFHVLKPVFKKVLQVNC